MNATEDGEPLGESPAIDTLTAIGRGAVLGTKQLAERQTQALNRVRELHERETTLCINCTEPWPCSTIRAIDEAGA